VFGVATVVLLIMVVLPLGWLFFTSLQQPDSGALTLHNYVEAFTTPIYLRPIVNSLILASGVATIAVCVGTPLAWLLARADLPARGALRALIVAAFVTPSFLGAEAWMLLAAPNSGWLNKAWTAVTGAEHGPLNIYSLAGAIFVMALYNIPYTFTLVSGALELMPAEMEDAAAILGASTWRRTVAITLPLALPAIVGGFILSFLEASSEFGAPAFLLIPARQQVVTTQLYEFFQYPIRIELAAAYAIPMLLVTVALLLGQRALVGRKRYDVIAGKGVRRRLVALGRWRWPALALALIPPSLSVLLPYGCLLLTSLSRAWGKGLALSNLTLYWYRWAIFDNQTTQAAIVHSFLYSFAAATLALGVALSVAYIVSRKLAPGAGILSFVAMAPFVVPGIILAIGFYSAFSHKPLLLYGTAWMLIVAFATRFLPIAFTSMRSALQSINIDLENAARTLGAGRLRALGSVTLPLVRRGLLSSWLLAFIPSLRELSCAIFLFTPGTAVMSTVIFDFSDAGNFEAVATMGILLMLTTLAFVALAYRFAGRELITAQNIQ
jgi:iron(III) transport system permease protein